MAEEFDELEDDDNTAYTLTPWGCLFCVLRDYGIDMSRITDTIGKHLVEDFMDLMVKSGNVVRRAEGEE